MSHSTILLAIPAAIILVSIRFHWIVWQMERHAFLTSYWMWRTKQPVEVAGELTKVWPIKRIIFDPFHWNWRHYVIAIGLYDEMVEWMDKELAREDLGPEAFAKEIEAMLAGLTPPPSPSDAPSNPNDSDSDSQRN